MVKGLKLNEGERVNSGEREKEMETEREREGKRKRTAPWRRHGGRKGWTRWRDMMSSPPHGSFQEMIDIMSRPALVFESISPRIYSTCLLKYWTREVEQTRVRMEESEVGLLT